jgi:hypothetical protein
LSLEIGDRKHSVEIFHRKAIREAEKNVSAGKTIFSRKKCIHAKLPTFVPGMPDGIFSKPKIPIWENFGVP